ncbi:Fe(3+)-transporting ATPase [Lentilactobacillus senioris DSM 24302 = JCM 17472]|uniref:Energy-coupling factor transporter ATP-binding protein EcfA2 n=1 Tax=Lentilactobacillus senioris DSM 24302 = JCM 17472 TaxID=1423802 RepID=A0A0R2CYQ2_9LACO|nr:energy-coupling factor transporter ATPase [Lentilactobacillus senioris]KRM93129.1 Fe(3+)-transporting ATPase [Lentilactobacillus senioris DSM 24302 = JCM 17472]
MAGQIKFQNVNYVYHEDSPDAHQALKDINLTLTEGSFTAIIGHTGSGKSTLIQHINALIKPTSGEVSVGDYVITHKTTNKNLRPLRQKVGMVFQFPEKQIFEETVIKDIMFGPLNYGATEAEAKQAALNAMDLVGLPQQYQDQSPIDLSGGQMRRVAIAGVLAMNPSILILDEPTAGLDPRGHADIMALVARLHDEMGITIILVTHQMDDVVQYAEQVVVMSHGEITKQGSPQDIFADLKWVRQMQLTLPTSAEFAEQLKLAGFPLPSRPLTLTDLTNAILTELGANHG